MKIIKRLLLIPLAVILVIAGYVIYVFAAYHRIGDIDSLPVKGEGTAEALPEEKELTLLSFNIGFGAYSDDYSFFMDGGKYSRVLSREAAEENVSAVRSLIDRESPDLVLLQEVDLNSTRSYHLNETEMITEGAPYSSVFAQNYDSPYLFYPVTCPHGRSRSGILTLSSVKIQSAARKELPIETSVMKLIDLDRCYSKSYIPTEKGTLVLFNLHLSAYTSDGTIADEQLRVLTSDMTAEREAGNYVIAGGDFNKDLLGNASLVFGVDGGNYTWAKPIPEGIIPPSLTLCASDNAPSCRNADEPYTPGHTFVLTVDGFLVSDNVEALKCETLDLSFANSDHNPVKLTFKLK